jgi:transglutaminase-like putative cysteine protease
MLYRMVVTMRLVRIALFGALVLGIAATASLVFADAPKERKGVVTVEVLVNAPADAKEVRLWIPAPSTDGNQVISGAAVSGNYTASSTGKDAATGSDILYAEWKGGASERKLVYTFSAVRREVLNADLRPSDAPMPADMKKYLDLSWLGKTEERIRKEATEITKGQTTVLAKARAIYEWIVDNMRRDPNAKACGNCDVERLLSARMGKCADVHTVFVALCRAAGVPARDLGGIRLPKTKEGDMTKMQHCWAEFYLPGKGWVPVDAADVHKIIYDRKLSPEDAKKLPERAYFFGSLEENRILLGEAHGMLTPPQKGGPLVYFMYPYAEADGKPLGGDDPIGFNFGYKISFKEQ